MPAIPGMAAIEPPCITMPPVNIATIATLVTTWFDSCTAWRADDEMRTTLTDRQRNQPAKLVKTTRQAPLGPSWTMLSTIAAITEPITT